MFINDIPEAMSCVTRLFADDTKLYSVVSNEDDRQKLQDDIFEANNWSKKWQMIFNVKKCKFMQIGNRPEQTQYFMKDQHNDINQIQEVDSEKDLGITFDPKLTFSSHVNNKVKIANRNIGIIIKSFSYMSNDMFLTLYKSLVRPHLEYISPIWSPRFLKEQRAIENTQRRATRMVRNLSNKSYPERLKALGLPTLEYRRKRADMIQTYKIMHGHYNVNKNKLFPLPNTTSQNLRGNTLKINKKHVKTELRRTSFSQRVVDPWNKLPENVVSAPSINSFKNRLNKNWVGGPNKFKPMCLE